MSIQINWDDYEKVLVIEKNARCEVDQDTTQSPVLKSLREVIKNIYEYWPRVWRVVLKTPFCCQNHLDNKAEICGRALTGNGSALRLVIDAQNHVEIYKTPVLLCPDCQKRNEGRLKEGRLQYCHRILLPHMVKGRRFKSEVYELFLTEGFDLKQQEVAVYFSEEGVDKLKKWFRRLTDLGASTLGSGQMERFDLSGGFGRGRTGLLRRLRWVWHFLEPAQSNKPPPKNWFARLCKALSNHCGNINFPIKALSNAE